MPLYEYECTRCGKQLTEVRTVDKRRQPKRCVCNGKMAKIMSTEFAVNAFTPYFHQNLAPGPVYIQNSKQEKHEFDSRGLIDAR